MSEREIHKISINYNGVKCEATVTGGDAECLRMIAEEVTSLRAQVEELRKFPEEAVRAMFEYLYPAPVVEKFMEINGDKLATIFKEKQGVGK